jgi:hypothetical protein
VSLPQGIYFRATDDQVDPTNYEVEVGTTANYSSGRLTAQGNAYGWESAPAGSRDRGGAGAIELRGIHFVSGSPAANYRIDLPATGSYNIRAAFGDETSGQFGTKAQFKDTTTVLSTPVPAGTTIGLGHYIDATGVDRTSQSDWSTNNAALTSQTFATTIFRVAVGGDTGNAPIAAVYIESAGGAAYTLTAAQGSYTLTGQAAGLAFGHKLAAAQGAYTLTGQAALFVHGYKLTAGQGSYTLTGEAAGLAFGHKLALGQGSYTLTGEAAGLAFGHKLALGQGSYTLTGEAATLTYTPKGAYVLTANQGSYALTGQAALLTAARKLLLAQGAYSLTGETLALFGAHRISLAGGSYALTGEDVAITTTGHEAPPTAGGIGPRGGNTGGPRKRRRPGQFGGELTAAMLEVDAAAVEEPVRDLSKSKKTRQRAEKPGVGAFTDAPDALPPTVEIDLPAPALAAPESALVEALAAPAKVDKGGPASDRLSAQRAEEARQAEMADEERKRAAIQRRNRAIRVLLLAA